MGPTDESPPRWSARTAVRRDDQFTAAPDFRDEHDSDHLPMWGRISASWHGMAPQRRVALAAGILVVAGAFAALAVFTSQDLSSPSGPSGGSGPVAAHGGSSSLPTLPPGNLTSPSPSPLPSLPSLPGHS